VLRRIKPVLTGLAVAAAFAGGTASVATAATTHAGRAHPRHAVRHATKSTSSASCPNMKA
jgi:hypothetical protein